MEFVFSTFFGQIVSNKFSRKLSNLGYQNGLVKPFGSSGLERIGPRGLRDPRSLGLSLEPARAKWTLKFQAFWTNCIKNLVSKMIQSWLQKWAGQPLGEYSRRDGRPHVGAFWSQIQPKSRQTWALFGIISPISFQSVMGGVGGIPKGIQ